MLFLKQERMKRGWSLTKLTVMTGIAPSDLSSIERGTRTAWPGWRKRISEAFDMSEEHLFKIVNE